MKQLLFIFISTIYTANAVFSQSIESKLKEFARSEYPNDTRMQNDVYKKQRSGYDKSDYNSYNIS